MQVISSCFSLTRKELLGYNSLATCFFSLHYGFMCLYFHHDIFKIKSSTKYSSTSYQKERPFLGNRWRDSTSKMMLKKLKIVFVNLLYSFLIKICPKNSKIDRFCYCFQFNISTLYFLIFFWFSLLTYLQIASGGEDILNKICALFRIGTVSGC